jgi:uncharacterized membrane protein YqiK
MPSEFVPILVSGGLLLALVIAVALWRMRVMVPPGSALIIHRTGAEPRVTFSDAFVPPLVARTEAIDCSLRTIIVRRDGGDSLRCRDNLRIDVRAEFRVSVNRTAEDILKVAAKIGANRASDPATLTTLFEARFIQAMASVVRELEFDEVTREREQLRDRVLCVIGQDLDGWVLEDVSFTRLEQVPIEELDPSNVLDAEAIRRITERTSVELLRKSEIENQTRLQVLSQKVATEEAALTLERRMPSGTR